MVRRALIVLCFGLMTVFMASCGQTYKLLSITVTPGALDSSGNSAIYLDGDAAFQQLTVTATYSNTKTSDVTLKSTYQIDASDYWAGFQPAARLRILLAPLSSVVANSTGIDQCDWTSCTWDTEPTN